MRLPSLIAAGLVATDCIAGQTDEEIEKRITDNPTGFAREALMTEGANEQVQQVYSEVQSRARDVEMLAASIREVHEMFQEFATLLAHQSEQIDNIEVTVRCVLRCGVVSVQGERRGR